MKPVYISASAGRGTTRIYIAADGKVYEHIGGTRAWRNNNPGNLEYGKFARDNGAIGSDGRFAIFPDAQTGWNAMVELLSRPVYQKLTMAQAINRYAPPHENDVENYLRSLERQTGLGRDVPMNSLTKKDLLALAYAMKRHEGDKAGKICLVTNK